MTAGRTHSGAHDIAEHLGREVRDVLHRADGGLVRGFLNLSLTALIGYMTVASVVAPTVEAAAPSGLHASGNRILDGSGQPVRLRGVNYSGSEYACIQGWGSSTGPATRPRSRRWWAGRRTPSGSR